MDDEGKFRDFMVGWLARQLAKPGANREKAEALYDEVVQATNDRAALTEVEAVVSSENAQRLWNTSEQWHDPTVEQARAMIEALRARVLAETQDHAQFYLFFLNPFKEGCVPAGYEEQVEQEICWMFRVFYSTVAEAVLASHEWETEVVVEPSYEDVSNIVVLAHPAEDANSKVFLFQSWYKAWHLCFASLTELAEALLALRQAMEQQAPPAILGYHLAKTVAEVTSQVEKSLTDHNSKS